MEWLWNGRDVRDNCDITVEETIKDAWGKWMWLENLVSGRPAPSLDTSYDFMSHFPHIFLSKDQ